MTITQFANIPHLHLRDQMEHIVHAIKALDANLDEAPRMLAGAFAANYRRGIRQGRINLVTAMRQLVLDSRTAGLQVEVMATLLAYQVDEGLGLTTLLLARAEKIA